MDNILNLVKLALRITSDAFNAEILNLIDAAQRDLALGGVTNINLEDPLIQRAIITYCKAHFGYDNPDADRLEKAYSMLKLHLTLSSDYTGV